MTDITILSNGISLFSRNAGNPQGGNRTSTAGWTAGVAGRFVRWLFGIDADRLTGHGYAFTLTIRDCPPSASLWQNRVSAYMLYLKRSGAIRWQVLTEWQRRGVPHLHGIAYYPAECKPAELVANWLRIAAIYNPLERAQNCKPVSGVMGWLQYQAKHSYRSITHYQRAGKPDGWSSTGRMWRVGGEWPVKAIYRPIQGLNPFEWVWTRRLVKQALTAAHRRREPRLELPLENGKVPWQFVIPVADRWAAAGISLVGTKEHREWRRSMRRLRRLNRTHRRRTKQGKTLDYTPNRQLWIDQALMLRILHFVNPELELVDDNGECFRVCDLIDKHAGPVQQSGSDGPDAGRAGRPRTASD